MGKIVRIIHAEHAKKISIITALYVLMDGPFVCPL